MKMKIKISHCNSFKAIAIKNEDKQICTFVEIDLRPFFFFFVVTLTNHFYTSMKIKR